MERSVVATDLLRRKTGEHFACARMGIPALGPVGEPWMRGSPHRWRRCRASWRVDELGLSGHSWRASKVWRDGAPPWRRMASSCNCVTPPPPPQCHRDVLIQECHVRHLGGDLRADRMWVWVSACQARKPAQFLVPEEPWAQVAMDLMGPLP